jgi:hypothetical protein
MMVEMDDEMFDDILSRKRGGLFRFVCRLDVSTVVCFPMNPSGAG